MITHRKKRQVQFTLGEHLNLHSSLVSALLGALQCSLK